VVEETPYMNQEIQFCPYCGKKVTYKLLFGLQRPICEDCNWIHFADPKVAAAVLIVQNNKVLLTRRMNDPYRGFWSLPAGFINAHEDPQDAARRECLEETGLQVEITKLFEVFSVHEHERGADILIVYTANVLSGILTAGDDADQAAFFDLNDLPPLAFTSTSKILDSLNQ
jgi:ADP-ribose pyrophosphatase YjhB (NUDIX family)